jgi:hypothetical protein
MKALRTIFRWIHIVFAIPILGYIYSPFDKLPDYAFKTRFIFVPIMIVSGLWMWKGHVVRRLFGRNRSKEISSLSRSINHEQNESQGGWTSKESQKVA